MANAESEIRMPPKYKKLKHGIFHSEGFTKTPISTLSTSFGAILTVLFIVVLIAKLVTVN